MGKFSNRASNSGVDPNLLSWIQQAAAQSGYDVALQSGLREGDPRYHGKGMAADVQLIDPQSGKVISNYQDAASFKAYQEFANQVRAAQLAANPDLANKLRWGGYFSGPKGKYGAMDLMHFDVGGDQTPMGGGGWDAGLTAEQAKLWGLDPGGGYTGTGAVASVLAPATVPATEARSDPFGALASAAATPATAAPAAAVGGGDGGGMPGAALDYSTAAIGAAPFAAQAARAMAPPPALADIFRVRDIGQAGTAFPGKRF